MRPRRVSGASGRPLNANVREQQLQTSRMSNDERYWFRVRRYGWGWVPCSWQGWVLLLLWFGGLVLGRLLIPPHSLEYWLGFVAVMLGVLLLICYKKGEPPRWRWGNRP